MWYGLLRNKHCQYCENNMDLEYIIKNGENSTQITEGNSYDEAVKIVYIILLSAAMILGTFGNLLVSHYFKVLLKEMYVIFLIENVCSLLLN